MWVPAFALPLGMVLGNSLNLGFLMFGNENDSNVYLTMSLQDQMIENHIYTS